MTTTIITKRAAAKVSNHVAEIGDRVRVEGVVRAMFGSGTKVLHVIHDIDGNEFIVRRKSLASKPGVLVSIEANVVAHTVYRDVKRTELSYGEALNVLNDHPFLVNK